MNVQGFVGTNTRDAMRKVKEVLGEDALILSNRKTDEGIEIMAALEAGYKAPVVTFSTIEPVVRGGEGEGERELNSADSGLVADSERPSADAWNERLFREMRDMRDLLSRSQPAENTTPATSNNKLRVRQLITEAGFSGNLADEISANLPDRWNNSTWQAEGIQTWLMRQMTYHLPPAISGSERLDEGGVFALIGPTGSGKTTTTAKIAARYVMRHGSDGLALVSTDHFRVGAHDHLREYAELLNVEFVAVTAGRSLKKVLSGLKKKKVVLIDTVGLSQRDNKVMEQFNQFRELGDKPSLMLLLNASSHQKTLEEVVSCYRMAAATAGMFIEQCIFTKLDEAHSVAGAMDKAMRAGMSPLYSTSGQRVPEDLDEPDMTSLLSPLVENMFRKDPGEPLPVISRSPDWTRELLIKGREISMVLKMLRGMVGGFNRLETLWDTSLLHPGWQKAQIDELLAEELSATSGGNSVLWASAEHIRDCSYPCPDLLLDTGFMPTCSVLLRYRLPAGSRERLQSVADTCAVTGANLFMEMPGTDTLEWLVRERRSWLVALVPSQLLAVGDRQLPASELASRCEPQNAQLVRYCGRNCEMRLSKMEASLMSDQGGNAVHAQLWCSELSSRDADMTPVRKYWLFAGDKPCENLIGAWLAAEEMPELTRRAMSVLDTIPGFQHLRDLRLLVAGGLVAIAMHLDLSVNQDAAEVRTRLMQISGDKNAYSTQSIVDALCYLFIAREVTVPGRIC